MDKDIFYSKTQNCCFNLIHASKALSKIDFTKVEFQTLKKASITLDFKELTAYKLINKKASGFFSKKILCAIKLHNHDLCL
jgi:hypothetical protein